MDIPDKVGLSRFLESHDSRGLEPEVSLEVLCDFPNESLEGKFADEKFGGLLVPTDFTKCDCSRTTQVNVNMKRLKVIREDHDARSGIINSWGWWIHLPVSVGFLDSTGWWG